MRGDTLLGAVVLLAAVIVLGQQAADALGDKVEAGNSGNTVTCNFGLTPEQLKQVTEAAVKGTTGPLVDRIADISKTLGVTEDAANTLLKIVGKDEHIPEEKLAEELTKVAGDYKRLQAQVAALNPDNPTAKALVDEAKPEIDAGHFARAHDLLRQATQAQIAAAQEARKLREQAQAAEDAQMLGAASSTAAEGDVALTERRYREAADATQSLTASSNGKSGISSNVRGAATAALVVNKMAAAHSLIIGPAPCCGARPRDQSACARH
jgi:hypothetical protein